MKQVNLIELKEKILYKRVIEWNEEFIKLEDGTKITLECTEQDCCAGAYGKFIPKGDAVPLDAMITDIVVGEEINIPDEDTVVNKVELKILHNQNIICEAEMTADAGNGGYYYSVGSLVVGDLYVPIVSA